MTFDAQWREQWVGYVITGRGESGDIVITTGPDSLIERDPRVIQNAYIVQTAAEAFAADNNGVYAMNGSSRNPVGKTLTDYLPGGVLLMNSHTGYRTEPSWSSWAYAAGGVGYVVVDVNADRIMDGYMIDGIGSDGATQIIFICGGSATCN